MWVLGLKLGSSGSPRHLASLAFSSGSTRALQATEDEVDYRGSGGRVRAAAWTALLRSLGQGRAESEGLIHWVHFITTSCKRRKTYLSPADQGSQRSAEEPGEPDQGASRSRFSNGWGLMSSILAFRELDMSSQNSAPKVFPSGWFPSFIIIPTTLWRFFPGTILFPTVRSSDRQDT